MMATTVSTMTVSTTTVSAVMTSTISTTSVSAFSVSASSVSAFSVSSSSVSASAVFASSVFASSVFASSVSAFSVSSFSFSSFSSSSFSSFLSLSDLFNFLHHVFIMLVDFLIEVIKSITNSFQNALLLFEIAQYFIHIFINYSSIANHLIHGLIDIHCVFTNFVQNGLFFTSKFFHHFFFQFINFFFNI